MFTKLKQASAEQVVLAAVLIGVGVFILWTVIIVFIAQRVPASGPDLWSIFEGLSSAAAFALAVGGGIVVLVQVNESIDSRNLAVFNDIFQRLMSDEEIQARRWIYTQMEISPETGMPSLTDADRDRIKRVLNTFDYLGFLLEQGWVSQKAGVDIIEFVMPIVNKTWAKVGPYIEYESSRRNDPHYYRSAKHLAQLCQHHYQQSMPAHEDYTFIEDAL